MKYLHDKIQKDSSCKVRINKDLYSNDRCVVCIVDGLVTMQLLKNKLCMCCCSIHEAVPALPDFAVALKPEEYRLPAVTVDAANG